MNRLPLSEHSILYGPTVPAVTLEDLFSKVAGTSIADTPKSDELCHPTETSSPTKHIEQHGASNGLVVPASPPARKSTDDSVEKELEGLTPRDFARPQRSQDANNGELVDHNLKSKVASGHNAVISEFGGRGRQGRRLTFLMQEVPDVLFKGQGDTFVQEAQKICGTDIFEEEPSSDEEWTPKSVEDDMIPVAGAPTEKELDEHLTAELLAANDETDRLYRLDTLADDGSPVPAADSSSLGAGTESVGDETQPSTTQETARMDSLQLRLWFMRVRKSYNKGVKVIKVSRSGKKFVRSMRVDDKFLHFTKGGNLPERKCHLSCIRGIRLGFGSDNFRNLLEISPEDSLVPPPQSCVSIDLPHQTVSMILPSEQARNECLLLLRVLVRQAKRRYADNSGLKASVANDVL